MIELAFLEEHLPELASYVRDRYADRGAVTIGSKAEPTDYVTEVDLAVQQMLEERIRAAFPGDHVVGEEDLTEFPEDPDARCWIIDPIDGTSNFVRGLFPSFGISVGFVQWGNPVVGGVMLPMTGDLFLAERGAGATRNGERIHVSAVDDLAAACAEVDFSIRPHRAPLLDVTRRLIEETGQIRCHCAAVVPLCSIATGDIDLYVHVALNPWDYVAAMLVVEEAGGKATQFDGAPLTPIRPGRRSILASNGVLHETARAKLDLDDANYKGLAP
jgi:myo-inositol-1(or 4)-monophosphatase